MTEQYKGTLIGLVVHHMRDRAARGNKAFDAGDLFFSLAFRTDAQLKTIAKSCGIDCK